MINGTGVVEYFSGTVQSFYAFADNEESAAEAETLFKKLATENGADEDDPSFAFCLVDGLYEQGDYQVFLMHSN